MESSSQTSRVAPTVHKVMIERVTAETAIVMMSSVVKASASAEVVERVRRLGSVVQDACTILEGKENHCSTRSVRSEELTAYGRL